MRVTVSRAKGCAVPTFAHAAPGTGVTGRRAQSGQDAVSSGVTLTRRTAVSFVTRSGTEPTVAHLLAVDLDDPADRTDATTEPHQPLRRTWIIGWHEARQLGIRVHRHDRRVRARRLGRVR